MGFFNKEKESLEQRADDQLGFINDFVESLSNARFNAEELNSEAQVEIDKAKKVQTKCNTVTKFVDKILKNV